MSQSPICRAIRLLPVFPVLIASTAFCHAQVTGSEGKVADREGPASALELYERTLATALPVYRGSIYKEYHRGLRGHPFWMNDDWEYGRLMYDGQWYLNLYLRYDVMRDIVLLQGFDELGFLVSLEINQLKTQAFEITDQKFVHEQSGIVAENIGSGYYELHYDGKVRVLAKRRKSIQQKVTLNRIDTEFQEVFRLYIEKEGNVYPVKRRGRIIALLDDPGHNLRNHMRAMGTKSGADIIRTACEAAAFHDRSVIANE